MITRVFRSATAVPFVDKRMALEFVRYVAKKKAIVYTDEAKVYDDLDNHETVRHSVGEYVRDQIHTNGIESFPSFSRVMRISAPSRICNR
ncbi:MAG: transposase [Bryobacterales bacterium]|nr:transposase [Bryobacterales bacterium]